MSLATIVPSLIFSLATSPSVLNNVSSDVDNVAVKRAAARTELAVAYYSEKQYGAALTELKQAVEAFPDYFPAHNMMGIVSMELKRNDEAEKSFRTALSLDNENPDTNNNYGWFLCQTNRIQDAYSYFIKAATNPSYSMPSRAYYNAGKCAQIEGQEGKAMAYYIEALKVDSKATAVLLEIGQIYLKNKRLEDAIQVVDQIIEIEGSNPQALWLGIKVEKLRGNAADVESYGSQLVNKFPKSPEAAMWKARAFD